MTSFAHRTVYCWCYPRNEYLQQFDTMNISWNGSTRPVVKCTRTKWATSTLILPWTIQHPPFSWQSLWIQLAALHATLENSVSREGIRIHFGAMIHLHHHGGKDLDKQSSCDRIKLAYFVHSANGSQTTWTMYYSLVDCWTQSAHCEYHIKH